MGGFVGWENCCYSGSMKSQVAKPVVPAEANQYPGEWVALHPVSRKIIAHHKRLDEVANEAEKRGVSNAVFHGVPEGKLHRHYRVVE